MQKHECGCEWETWNIPAAKRDSRGLAVVESSLFLTVVCNGQNVNITTGQLEIKRTEIVKAILMHLLVVINRGKIETRPFINHSSKSVYWKSITIIKTMLLITPIDYYTNYLHWIHTFIFVFDFKYLSQYSAHFHGIQFQMSKAPHWLLKRHSPLLTFFI